MLSGMDFVDSVDDRLRRAEREAQAAQQETEELAARRDAARHAEAEALRELARIRLATLADGGAALGRLDAAEDRVRALLAERSQGLRDAEAALALRLQALEAAQAGRDRAAGELRRLEAEEQAGLDAARERAAADPAWQGLRAAAAEAARTAAHAAEKAKLAQQDLEAKGRPYRADPLFAYLWERGFGTPRYRAFPLVRLLDAWVARVAAYEPARRNYTLLTELPGRLDTHAAAMAELAQQAAGRLRAAGRRIAGLAEDGAALMAAQAALEAAEQAMEAARAAADEAEAARAALAGGQDAVLREAEASLEAALGAQDLRALRESARRTPSPDDDAVVARLEDAAAGRAEIERTLRAAQQSAEAARQRVAEARQLRSEMLRRGYGRSRWDFKDGALVGALISEVLRGALSRDGFWDRLGQHRRPGPWGGSGGAPGPWGGGGRAPGPWDNAGGGWQRDETWDVPGPWGGGDKGGGFGGSGGFRTGGSIGGGGGFKTGGSF